MSAQPSTLVVIVNYKTADLTIDCLHSLAPEIEPGVQVVITDNASGDDSVIRLQRAIDQHGWAAWARLMPLPHNGGFAYGNNAAIKEALQSAEPPDYVWLLNPDTLVKPGVLKELVAGLERHPGCGIAGSRTYDDTGEVFRSAFRFPTIRGEVEQTARFGPVSKLLAGQKIAPPPTDHDAPCDWVAGASMLIKRDVFEKIGLLDEGYFMYFEEVDFCRRAKDAGFETWYIIKSEITHLVGQASGVTDTKKPRKRRPKYWFDSRRRYLTRHHGRAKTFIANLLWLTVYPLSHAIHQLRGKRLNDPPRMWRDFLTHNLLNPS